MSTLPIQGKRGAAVLLLALLCAAASAPSLAKLQQIDGLGALDFPTSTRSAEAQAAFAEGMLLLHVFEYTRAEAAFRKAQRLDPDFAMAYWGETMTATHPVWNQQDVAQGRAALAKLGADAAARAAKAPTAREKAYLAAAEILYGEGSKPERDRRFLAAMEKLAAEYLEDDEARLFQSLALLGVTQGERDVPNFLRAAELAKAAFARNPRHPGAAHYWIHGMDDPAHAAGALDAANALARIAPDAGHSQHMTAHIFMALGMWDAVVASNQAASRVVAEQLRAAGQPPFVCGHYAEWLQYGYFQQGRHREAYQVLVDCQRDSAKNLAWLQAHPGQRVLGFRAPADFKSRMAQSQALMRSMAIVESAPLRGQAAALAVDESALGSVRAWAVFGRGLERAWRDDLAGARGALAELKAVAAATNEDPVTAKYREVMRLMLEGVLAERAGERERGLRLVAEAAALYDAIPFDFGPPVPVKPPHELRGELLLAAARPKAALAEFELALKTAPLRARSLLGRARALAALGDQAGARAAYGQLQGIWQRADAGLPELAEVRAYLRR